MTSSQILVALLWGATGGFFATQALANLVAVGFCLHGILLTRWKRLRRKAAIGTVNYNINLKLLCRVGAYAMLSVIVLQWGDEFVRREYRFKYIGVQVAVSGLMAGSIFAVCGRSVWYRLQVVWKMSHQFDYAERRERTRMLKS